MILFLTQMVFASKPAIYPPKHALGGVDTCFFTDFTTQERILKDSGIWFGKVARVNALLE